VNRRRERAWRAADGKHGEKAQRRVVGWVGTWREVSQGLDYGQRAGRIPN